MNEKFSALPKEKQQAILRAGYRVFSQNSYKKSPMQEIAEEAGISKSLLFYYFRNKRALYLYLWDHCARVTISGLKEHGCYGQADFFEILLRGMRAKLAIMRQYPEMGRFVVRAFYEKDPQVGPVIRRSVERYRAFREEALFANLDRSRFADGLDLSMMIREMYLASEGYLWEMLQQGSLDPEKMERDFLQLIGFWRSVYEKKEGENEGH